MEFLENIMENPMIIGVTLVLWMVGMLSVWKLNVGFERVDFSLKVMFSVASLFVIYFIVYMKTRD